MRTEPAIPAKTDRIASNTVSLILFITLVSSSAVIAQEKEGQQPGECDVHHTSCTKPLPGCDVTLDITPKPVKAMKALTFRVALSGKKPSALPFIDLGMPGMDMGRNRVQLKPVGEGTYEGSGIIVRCPSGRRTWKAVVTLPDMGTVEFVFDVIY